MSNSAKRSNKSSSVLQVMQEVPSVKKEVQVISATELQQMGNYPFRAVLPILEKTTLSLCYKRYREYETLYNDTLYDYNIIVGTFNNRVEKTIIDSTNKESYQQQAKNFKDQHRLKNVWEYNHTAQEYNMMFPDPIIELRQAQPLKNNHRDLFDMILRQYQIDLFNMKRMQQRMGKTHVTTIPRVDVNTSHLTDLNHLGGAKMTLKTRVTLRRTKQRLEEAGILQDKAFRGHKRGVLYFITPQILAVLDDFDGEILKSDNQLVISPRVTKCYDSLTLTCTINKPIIKGVVEKTTPIRKKAVRDKDNLSKNGTGFLSRNCRTDSFTCTPSGKVLKKPIPPTKEKNNVSPGKKYIVDHAPLKIKMPADTLKNKDASDTPEKPLSRTQQNSEHLRETILEPWEFCVQIGNKELENRPIIPLEALYLEVKSGYLPQDEFNELILQNIFWEFAKVYSQNPNYYPYHKIWKEIYDVFLNSYFFNHRKGHYLNKKTVLERYQTLLFCINNKRYGILKKTKKGKFTPPRIEVYLNPYSATPGTFFHYYKLQENKGKKWYNDKILAIKKYRLNAKKSILYQANIEKMFRYFKAYEKHRDLQKLLSQVQQNLPKEVQNDFDIHWQNFLKGLNYKNHAA